MKIFFENFTLLEYFHQILVSFALLFLPCSHSNDFPKSVMEEQPPYPLAVKQSDGTYGIVCRSGCKHATIKTPLNEV